MSELKELEKTVSFIDIGTNSARLLVVKIHENGSYQIISRIKDLVRLGEGEFETKRIQPEAVTRLLLVCRRFVDLSNSFGATETIAVATSAMREAINSGEIAELIARELGLEIQIISGKEEARLIHLGVAAGINLGSEQALFIDIGGGSTELIVGGQYSYSVLESMQIGAIRVTGRCIKDGFTGAMSQKHRIKMQNHVKAVAGISLKRISEHPFTRCIGSSGTIINLAEIAQRMYHPGAASDARTLQISDLDRLFLYLCSLTLEERRKVPGINPERAEIILAGACILQTVMEGLKISEIEVSDRGLREGIFMDYLAKIPGTPQSKQMPVQDASVLQLGKFCRIEEEHAKAVQRLTLSLFDSGKNCGLHSYGEWERGLLLHAAWLHDTGDFLSFAKHHQHGEYIIRNTELLGFDQREIMIISKIVRYHRKKLPGRKDPEFQECGMDCDRVRVMSEFLRIAELLCRSHMDVIVDAVFTLEGERVRIEVTTVPGTDLTLEMMSLGKESSVFYKVFGRELLLPDT